MAEDGQEAFLIFVTGWDDFKQALVSQTREWWLRFTLSFSGGEVAFSYDQFLSCSTHDFEIND